MDRIHLQIVTADGSVCDEKAGYVLVPVKDGDEGILADHAAMTASLTEGVLRYRTEDNEHFVAVSGGVMSLADNELIILAQTAERAESIDMARAQASEKRARERLESRSSQFDMKRAELSLHRALAREKAYTLLHK